MQRVTTYSALAEVHASDLNAIQDDAAPASGVWGLALGGFDTYCLDGAAIAIRAVASLTMGATGLVGVASTVAITPSGLATLTNNAWWYVYATVSAGAIAYEVSATAPDATGIFKTGDTSRRYVTCFHTYSSATTIRCFNRTPNGRYVYRFTAMNSTEGSFTNGALCALQDTTTSASGTADLTQLVTPAAKIVLLRASLKFGDGTHLGAMTLRPTGDPSGGGFGVAESFQNVPHASDVVEYVREMAIGFASHPAIDYSFTAASSVVTGNILVTGFQE